MLKNVLCDSENGFLMKLELFYMENNLLTLLAIPCDYLCLTEVEQIFHQLNMIADQWIVLLNHH